LPSAKIKHFDLRTRTVKVVDIIQNDPEVPIGLFGELLEEWCVPFRLTRLDIGASLPAAADAVIVLGGTMGVHDDNLHPFLPLLKQFMSRVQAEGTPLLGICLGAQLLAEVAGGVVRSNACGERGLVAIKLTTAGKADPLFTDILDNFLAFQWHNDSFTIPTGALHLAESAGCAGQAFRIGNAWGVQFHPEVDGGIVAAWSNGLLTHEFALAEAANRALARQLLVNFLATVNLPTN
jgi:GMP synthase-like glutamine amidotransferase